MQRGSVDLDDLQFIAPKLLEAASIVNAYAALVAENAALRRAADRAHAEGFRAGIITAVKKAFELHDTHMRAAGFYRDDRGEWASIGSGLLCADGYNENVSKANACHAIAATIRALTPESLNTDIPAAGGGETETAYALKNLDWE